MTRKGTTKMRFMFVVLLMLIELQIVEKWNGVSPMVVGSGTGANILLPMTGGK